MIEGYSRQEMRRRLNSYPLDKELPIPGCLCPIAFLFQEEFFGVNFSAYMADKALASEIDCIPKVYLKMTPRDVLLALQRVEAREEKFERK